MRRLQRRELTLADVQSALAVPSPVVCVHGRTQTIARLVA
jgi:hypothetical protein